MSIVKEIPKFPNDKATKQILEEKSLANLLINYMNWMSRYVPPRPRIVQIEPTATVDSRWRTLRPAIYALLVKVRAGEDLIPHLSLQIHNQGFTPAASAKGPNVDTWADKDFLLNVMGFHHFHLGESTMDAGHVERTDEVVFAEVTRDKFNLIAIFDHSVFEKTNEVTKTMTAERDRLWDIFNKRSSRGMPPGAVYVPAAIMTSGHAEHHVRMADYYAKIVRETDPLLEDRSFVNRLYTDAGLSVPARPKLKWHFHFLDLCLFDEAQKVYFVLHKGSK
ncbi:hypothetical protein [Geobacter grbiciae]|uniref:hypothetical protein n=1 Tax=Geobacter grbiciae TaxID=155042 RepID=UPI001C0392D2|nr:hypothetical protein [Geobacter grbiciae]MBT1077333.1 hypothetical protein [Geobacter grbiciae]